MPEAMKPFPCPVPVPGWVPGVPHEYAAETTSVQSANKGDRGLARRTSSHSGFYFVNFDVLAEKISPCSSLLGIFHLLEESALLARAEQFERW